MLVKNPYCSTLISVGSCYLSFMLVMYVNAYINAEGVSKTEEVTEDWQHLHIVEIPDCTHRQISSE